MVETSVALHVEEEQRVPLLVVGGGLAGVCAAIAAARQGVRVALLQDRPVLGGNSSSEIRVHPVGASHHGYNRDARETGLIEELFLEARARAFGLRQVNGRAYPLWDVALAEMAEAEPNLRLLLNARVLAVQAIPSAEDGYASRIAGVTAVQMATERVVRFVPDCVVDATGDGVVAFQAGAPYRYGREARRELGEALAPEEADDLVLGSSILFSARDVGRPVPFAPPPWAHCFPDEAALPYRAHETLESGYWWIEWGGRLRTIADNDVIRRELHAVVFGVWDHVKNRCTVPGVRERAATYALDWVGHLPGKRESRRFEGDCLLTANDVLDGLDRVPMDVVAHGGWPIDVHPPDGVYASGQPCFNPPLPGLYGIPFRALYSRTVANLLLAGRDISASHLAHASARVMKTCAVIGQASGTAAALCVQRGVSPRRLASDTTSVHLLQQRLLRAGAYLPFVRNADPDDLALRPAVGATASSEARLYLNPAGVGDHWENAGMSTLESRGMDMDPRARLVPEAVPLGEEVAQALVLSTGRLEAVSLRLRNAGSRPATVRLRVRPMRHLRDFGPRHQADRRDAAVLDAAVPAGESTVTFAPPAPLCFEPDRPVALVLEPAGDVAWMLSAEEPPGTQAARWDEGFGYWRFLHGTLWASVAPASAPYGPRQALSGVGRPEQAANLWVSDPAQPLPQWLQLTWPQPVTLASVELTFDSQLSGWIWEGTFPLVARDYRLEACPRPGGAWETVVAVAGNAQRRRVHAFAPRSVQALRVVVAATNGGRTARLVEVRAYPPAAAGPGVERGERRSGRAGRQP